MRGPWGHRRDDLVGEAAPHRAWTARVRYQGGGRPLPQRRGSVAAPGRVHLSTRVPRKVEPGKATTPITYKATTPIAKALFEIDGVVSLFFLNDFVTITKRPEAEWEPILQQAKAALEKHPHFV